MANCPNCGYKLKITDWRPECPRCGVNLVYYKMEERLRDDADKAELEYARSQPRIDRLKAAVYGNPWSIVRLVLLVLPVGALMLPLATLMLNLPFYVGGKTTSINAITVYNAVSSIDLNRLLTLTRSEIFGRDVVLFLAALAVLLLTVVLILVQFLLVMCSFGKKWYSRNLTVAGIGIALTGVSALLYALACKGFARDLPGVVSGGVNPLGLCGVLLSFLLIIGINVLIKVKKIEVPYTDVSELLLPYHERPSVIAAEQAAREAAAAKQADAAENGQLTMDNG